eukprot:symbB.v1.2.025247.t1/scaffold2442.1/size78961/2
METQSLQTRVQSSGFRYLRILVASRRRSPVPKEGSADVLLESLRKVFARIPPDRRVSQVTLLGFTLLPSEREDDAWRHIFDSLLGCSTISFRKCFCEASTLLHILQAIRHVLSCKTSSWIGLWVLPSCLQASESTELAAAFRDEMPLFLYALRESQLCHISRSGCKTCRIPAAPLDDDDRVWAGLVESSLDVNRFASMQISRRTKPKDDDRPDRIPAFFLHGVLYVWRFLHKPANVLFTKEADMDKSLNAAVAEVYVCEWLKNVTVPIQSASDIEFEEQRKRLGLAEPEMMELLKHLDYAIWALLRMHRALPFAPKAVKEIDPGFTPSIENIITKSGPTELGKEVAELSRSLGMLKDDVNSNLSQDRIAAMTSEDVPNMVTPVAASLKEVITSAKSLKERLGAIADAAYSIVGTATEDAEDRLSGEEQLDESPEEQLEEQAHTEEGDGMGPYHYGDHGYEDYNYGNGGYDDYGYGYGPDVAPDMVKGAQLPIFLWPFKEALFPTSKIRSAQRRPSFASRFFPSQPRPQLTRGLHSVSPTSQAGKLLVLRAPERYYRSGREQYELAVLFSAAAALSEYYIQVEDDIVAQEGFVKMLQDYVTQKINSNTTSWNMISTGREGLHRKLFRSHQLIRFAELLPIFPEVPPDSLLWDYIDVINNMSAPKACYIAFSATKIKRSDVILQYHKAEAIIEHVGDVSSLEGKVQRIHDDYFKKHNLLSTLFDNPAADIYPGGTIDPSTSTQLQALYGVHGNGPTMGGAPAVSLAVPAMADLVGKAVLEVVFRKPVAVQMLNLRMGGFLRPAAKNKKQPELADPDFDFVFSNAELSFGRAKTGEALAAANSAVGLRGRAGPSLPGKGFCNIYEPLMNFSGREVFWRSPTSRPAANVECIKVTLWEAPKTTVIVRTIRVRSAKPQRRLGETSEMMHHPGDATASMKLQPSRHWQVEMKSWAKMVTIAFAAGALAGTLGLALTTIPWIHPKARRRTMVGKEMRSEEF